MAGKDLRVYFRDKVAVLLGFGLPIALCTVFAGAMGAIGGSDSIGRIELVIEDADGSEASRALLAELRKSEGLRLDVLEAGSQDSARSRVAEGDAPAGLRIGPGFGAALAGDAELPLRLYRDPGKVIEQQILTGSLIPAFFGALGERLGKGMGRRVLATLDFPPSGRERAQSIIDSSWASMEALVERLRADRGAELDSGGDAPEGAPLDAPENAPGFDFSAVVADLLGLEIEDVVGGDQNKKSQQQAQHAQSVAGMAVMMLLFGLIHCGGTLIEEQDSGTLDRLRLTPGATKAILGGKFLFTGIVGLIQLSILFLYGNLVFDVPIFRAPLALVTLSIATAAAVTGFGVLFAVLARSRKQLEGLSTMVVLTMSALGGSWWPLAITPDWYQFLGHFTLNAWAMDGFQGIFWYGQGVLGILPEIGVLCGIALGTSLLAWRLWDRRMRV